MTACRALAMALAAARSVALTTTCTAALATALAAALATFGSTVRGTSYHEPATMNANGSINMSEFLTRGLSSKCIRTRCGLSRFQEYSFVDRKESLSTHFKISVKIDSYADILVVRSRDRGKNGR